MAVETSVGKNVSEYSPVYPDAHRLPRHRGVPHINIPHLPRRLPHIPHGRRVMAVALAGAIAAVGVNVGRDNPSATTEKTGPGGITLELENYPIGQPLTIKLDSAGNPVVKLDTDEPDVWIWRSDSTGEQDKHFQYLPVLGPKYVSKDTYGLGNVKIVMGEPENNPDIAFGGVWFERVTVVNGEVLPAGNDGQALAPGEDPIYSRADSIDFVVHQAPQVPARV